jgi:hypothetical protein
MHVRIVRSICHGAQSNNILRQCRNEVHDLLQCRLQSIKMLMLNFGCIPQIHPEGVTKPTKPLFDVFGRLSCFV